MLRVFHPGPWPEIGGEITLGGEESSHLVRVRRARVGETIVLLDGRGGVAECSIAEAEPRAAQLRMEKVTWHSQPVPRVLAVGLPKGDTFVEIIRQATELGATEIQPLLTARGEVKLDKERAEKKLDRWRATALEACKQSGNPWQPKIHAAVALGPWVKKFSGMSENLLRLVAALTPEAISVAELPAPRSLRAPYCLLPVIFCVGPEGDFSPEEYAEFKAAGFQFVRLPGHVLRVETACAVALAIVQTAEK